MNGHGMGDTTVADLKKLCMHSCKLFLAEDGLFKLNGIINIVGDIHGQYQDLLRIFERCGPPEDTM